MKSESLNSFLDKIKSFSEFETVLNQARARGEKIIQCHGVFDLIHPGHVRHFREAKSLGDLLVVTVTPDRFVNKGPGRPVFNERLRLESLAALADIDIVILNDSPDAVSAIRQVQPALYVKGCEYEDHHADVTKKIAEEVSAVEECHGKVHYTRDIVFSSSSLLNQHVTPPSSKVLDFISKIKQSYSTEQILEKLDALSEMRVLVIGDAMIDEYQYTDPLGQSGKGLHMVARCLEKEVFLGGSLIIANHVAQFAKEVTLVTAVGRECPYTRFISNQLDPKVDRQFTILEDSNTLVKKRYVLKDGKTLTKLFETYSGHEEPLKAGQTEKITQFISKEASSYDLILACDFGNGFTNPALVDALSDAPTFLALNAQTNSGNRGFNVVTNYRRADYISLNEPELRLSAHDRTSSLQGIASDICDLLQASCLSVTQGVHGVVCYTSSGKPVQIPAFATDSVDRIGAGDAFLSISSLSMAKKDPPELGGFLGSIAAAMSVQMVGNQEAIKKSQLSKYIIRLMK